MTNKTEWEGHVVALNRLVQLAQRGVQYAEGVERDTNYDSPLFGKSTAEEMEDEIEDLHEPIADLFILLSGKRAHASDCATSSAPAYMPAPCNCSTERQPTALEAERDALREALSGMLTFYGMDEDPHHETQRVVHNSARQALAISEKSE